MKSLLVIMVGTALGGGACSSDSPANVAGDYTMNVTSKANGCMFPNWTEGNVASGVGVTITQSGSHATIQVDGAAGVLFAAVEGTDTWSDATVDGAHVGGIIHGTVQQPPKGNCSWFRDAAVSADLTTDTLDGQITYTAETNHGTDCADLETCSSVQDINGLRPPT